MIFVRSIVFTCLAIALLSGCKKDTKEAAPLLAVKTIPVDPQLKQLGYFKPGTYWIFQDTVTNQIDSIYVTINQVDKYKVQQPDTLYEYERLTTLCVSNSYSIIININNDPADPNTQKVFNLFMTNYASGPIVNLNNTPYSIASASITSAYQTDSVLVNNTWFKQLNTTHFKHLGRDPMHYSTGYCHWKKGVGFVVLSSTYKGVSVCLKLIRMNIVQ